MKLRNYVPVSLEKQETALLKAKAFVKTSLPLILLNVSASKTTFSLSAKMFHFLSVHYLDIRGKRTQCSMRDGCVILKVVDYLVEFHLTRQSTWRLFAKRFVC